MLLQLRPHNNFAAYFITCFIIFGPIWHLCQTSKLIFFSGGQHSRFRQQQTSDLLRFPLPLFNQDEKELASTEKSIFGHLLGSLHLPSILLNILIRWVGGGNLVSLIGTLKIFMDKLLREELQDMGYFKQHLSVYAALKMLVIYNSWQIKIWAILWSQGSLFCAELQITLHG